MSRLERPRFTLAVAGDSFLATEVKSCREPDFLAVFDIMKQQT